MREYENFLQQVKNEHQDEYNELQDIVNRYNTLHESNQKLQQNLNNLNRDKEVINAEMANFIKEKKTDQMTITNEIGGLQKYLETQETEKSNSQSKDEENKLKRVQGTSEIGNIIMSVDNLYDKAKTKVDKKSENNDGKYKTFDDLAARGDFAIEQLEKIKNNTYFRVMLCQRMNDKQKNASKN